MEPSSQQIDKLENLIVEICACCRKHDVAIVTTALVQILGYLALDAKTPAQYEEFHGLIRKQIDEYVNLYYKKKNNLCPNP